MKVAAQVLLSKSFSYNYGVPSGTIGSTVANADFVTVGGQTLWTRSSVANTAEMLLSCPPLTTIIGRKAQAFINGKLEVLNFNTDNYVRGRYKDWEQFLRNPNPLQTDRQFRSQVYWYMQAFGFCPVLVKRPAGYGSDARPSSMWVLPPQFLKITCNDRYLDAKSTVDMVDLIEMKIGKESTFIDKSNVIFFMDTMANISNVALPDSKLAPLSYQIGNLMKNYEARGVIAEKRGAIGILSNTTADSIGRIDLKPKEKKELQDEYANYGFSKNQWQLIITNASLQYQSMTMPVRDMMLLETEKADIMAIADALNYPSVLLASEKGTTFSNQEGAKRSFYQDTIVPDAYNYTDQLNTYLKTEANNIKIQYDYSTLPILQKDALLEAQTLRETGLGVIYEFRNNVLTWNEMKIRLGQDTIPVFGDRYFYQMEDVYGSVVKDTANDSNTTASITNDINSNNSNTNSDDE